MLMESLVISHWHTPYLQCPSQQMTIMRQSSGKWWPVIENKGLLPLAAPELLLKGVDVVPELKDF